MSNTIVSADAHAPASLKQEGSEFARFMELRGRRVVESFGVLWHSVGYGLYMSLPYHRRLDLDPRDAGERLARMGALGVRYPSLNWRGSPSALYVCCRRDYDIPALHRNFRSHVRHGMPLCEVRDLTERELYEDALRINRGALRRQGRYDPEFGENAQWRRFSAAVQQSPCIGAIGAFVDKHLASYAITCLEDGWLHVLHKMADLRFDDRHPSQVLDFTITRSALSNPAVVASSMGWAPLISLPGLHEYKIRLGYQCEPQYSVIRLRSALQQVVTSAAGTLVLRAAQPFSGRSQTIAMMIAVADGVRHAHRCTVNSDRRGVQDTSIPPLGGIGGGS